jgi:tetratricopeptide (TPR) repeat protein
LENLPDILEPRGKIRIYFGLSQPLTEIGNYEESLKYCKEGIEYCLNHELMYLLSSLYYQCGENLIKLSRKEEGLQFLDKAIYILQLQENKKFIKIIENEKDKLLNRW